MRVGRISHEAAARRLSQSIVKATETFKSSGFLITCGMSLLTGIETSRARQVGRSDSNTIALTVRGLKILLLSALQDPAFAQIQAQIVV